MTQIRNLISWYFENKDVSPINLNNERKSLTLDVVSQNNSLRKIKTPSRIENEGLLTSETLNTKIKTRSCDHSISSKPSSKPSSKSSSNSRHTYLSILGRRKTAEQAKFSTIQTEERSKRKLKFLEKLFELEKEKLLDQVIEARNKAALVELERKHDEDIASSHSADSVKEQFKNSLLLYDDLKDKKHPFVDSNFKSFENNGKSNTSKFVKPLLEQKSNKKELSHSKTVENIKTKEFEMFPATKFREPIDSFIDRLVEGQETKISECEKDLDAKTALKLEFESRHLPVVPLYRFSGDASHWPEFIECFYTRVHCKSSFDDNIRMTYLLSVLDGEAKKAIEAVGTCGLFYASALKTLKREFGNTLLVSHLRLKSMFNKPQIKANDRSALPEFHQQIKLNITWLYP